jgi:hypothetical protein
MASRPTNIGIKAIELYFPSQASKHYRWRVSMA